MREQRTTRWFRSYKSDPSKNKKKIQMLTCYDFQTAQLLDELNLDSILVGDSLGNVILGYPNTIQVSLEEMILFSKAVKRGAPRSFVVADLPFGCCYSVDEGVKSSKELFQKSGVEAIKIEGAFPIHLEIIKRLTHLGIPVMGHIGLRPQSVHQQGGYFTHGKDESSKSELFREAEQLCQVGIYSLILECVEKDLADELTNSISVPTVGIGSGDKTDGQILVINDLLKLGKELPPSFCKPISNLFETKKRLLEAYLST